MVRSEGRLVAAKRPQRNKTSRVLALDEMRGLIMVLMALDHANYFVAQKHSSGEYWAGAFPVYHDALAFLTRLVTHLAAPGFFFIMGAGMWLFVNSRQTQGWTRWAITGHFFIRGLLLIALQLLIVNRAWELSPGGWAVRLYIGVLFALGGAMILGGLLLPMGAKSLLVLSFLLFVGMEFLVPAPKLWGTLSSDNMLGQLKLLLVYPGGTANLWSNYPLLPWLELVLLGMVFGRWLLHDPRQAFDRALRLGLVFLLAFVVIRWLDGFGNIRPREGNTWIDFLNVVKYPPSMAFTLMTMGVNLLLLSWFGRAPVSQQIFQRPLATFGRAPLFFYVTHLFLYAGIGRLFTPGGISILGMYPYWIVGLLILYPLSGWYSRFKRGQPASSPWRLL